MTSPRTTIRPSRRPSLSTFCSESISPKLLGRLGQYYKRVISIGPRSASRGNCSLVQHWFSRDGEQS